MEDGYVTTQRSFPCQPGLYRYKPIALLPWMPVQVIKESVREPDTLRVRCAGLTLPVSSLFAHGYWQGPIEA